MKRTDWDARNFIRVLFNLDQTSSKYFQSSRFAVEMEGKNSVAVARTEIKKHFADAVNSWWQDRSFLTSQRFTQKLAPGEL